MGFLLFLGLWLACGAATLALSVWLEPDKFDVAHILKRDHRGYEDIWQDYEHGIVTGRSVFTVGLWPIALIVVAIGGLIRVLVRSKREKLKLRDELEKELASAKREVEDLLRSTRR
jgi:hypothetical protein